jgi:nucleoside-diphosphate-sugar epimerase
MTGGTGTIGRAYVKNYAEFFDVYSLSRDENKQTQLFIHPQMWFEDKLIFENCGYVFHFNAIPQNDMGRDANYWIKRTYEEFYG